MRVDISTGKGTSSMDKSAAKFTECTWSLEASSFLTLWLNCPHEHLVSLHTQHRLLVFPPQYEDSFADLFEPTMYIYGVASFVAECLALFPWIFGLVSGFFQASAQMPPRGIYSDVTLPYLNSLRVKTHFLEKASECECRRWCRPHPKG